MKFSLVVSLAVLLITGYSQTRPIEYYIYVDPGEKVLMTWNDQQFQNWLQGATDWADLNSRYRVIMYIKQQRGEFNR